MTDQDLPSCGDFFDALAPAMRQAVTRARN
jgi:hypothetical protein